MPSSGNFDLADYFPYGVFLTEIIFKGASGDYIQVRDGSATGPIMCYIKLGTIGFDHQRFNGTKRFPYFVGTECSIASATMSSHHIIIEFR